MSLSSLAPITESRRCCLWPDHKEADLQNDFPLMAYKENWVVKACSYSDKTSPNEQKVERRDLKWPVPVSWGPRAWYETARQTQISRYRESKTWCFDQMMAQKLFRRMDNTKKHLGVSVNVSIWSHFLPMRFSSCHICGVDEHTNHWNVHQPEFHPFFFF